MKKLQIKREQLEMVAELYDGVSFFYDKENEQAIMLQDVLDTDLSSVSFDKDTTAIIHLTDNLKELLPLLEKYTIDNKTMLPRVLTQRLTPDEIKVFHLLGLHTLLVTASYLESIDEPEKEFLLLEISHPHSEEKANSKMESAIKKIRSLESDIYFYQVGKKCQKKLQK